jgi:hypothetical protein
MITTADVFQFGAGFEGIGNDPGAVLFGIHFEIVETVIQ